MAETHGKHGARPPTPEAAQLRQARPAQRRRAGSLSWAAGNRGHLDSRDALPVFLRKGPPAAPGSSLTPVRAARTAAHSAHSMFFAFMRLIPGGMHLRAHRCPLARTTPLNPKP